MTLDEQDTQWDNFAEVVRVAVDRANLTNATYAQQAAAVKADPETMAAWERLLNDTRPQLPLQPWTEHWPTFWETDHKTERFLAAPILAEGRGHALYAPAKTGKSLLVLEMCASIATGRPFLDMPARPAGGRKVLYIDYEMTPDDLNDRLIRFGYGAADDLDNLRYVRMPAIAPLDQIEGGQAVIQDAIPWGAELVVVDTQARAVAGDENAAETTRDFYRHTLMPLKSEGITTLRVDHAGKDLGRGMRGSSAKNDDVDVVWKLTAGGDRYRLEATHKRIGWVPDTVEMIRHDTYPMHRTAPPDEPEPPPDAETLEFIGLLDKKDIPTDLTPKQARACKLSFGDGKYYRAQRWRKQRAIEAVANPPKTVPRPTPKDLL